MNKLTGRGLLLVLLTFGAFASQGYTASENKLIEDGREQLQRLKSQNAANERAGRSHLNTYVLQVGTNADGPFIRQHIAADHSTYQLQSWEVSELDKKLGEVNRAGKIKTYVILVCGLPFEYPNGLPNDKTVLGILQDKQVGSQDRDYIQPMFNKAWQIVSAIAKPELDATEVPAIYCGYVLLQYYQKASKGTSIWLYLPVTKNIPLEPAYKQLLDAYVKKQKWGETGDLYGRVTNLVDVLGRTNEEFVRVNRALLDSDILKIQEPLAMVALMDKKLGGEYNLSTLSLPERIHALKIISIDRMVDRTERIVLNLLSTVPDKEIELLLTALVAPNEFVNSQYSVFQGPHALLKCILSGTDDVGLPWDSDNYKELMGAISSLIQHSPESDRRYREMEENREARLFVWDNSYALNMTGTPPVGTNEYAVKMTANGLLTVDKRENVSLTCTTTPEAHYVEFTMGSYEICEPIWESRTHVLNPFDLIVIYNRSDLPMLEMAGAQPDKRVVMPAIMLQYAQDKKENKISETLAYLALDAATIAVPFTRVYDLTVVAGRIYRTLDLMAAAGAAGDVAVRVAIIDEELAPIVDCYNQIIMVTNIAALAGGTRIASDLATKFLVEFENSAVRRKLLDLVASGNAGAKKVFNMGLELVEEAKKIDGDWLEQIRRTAKQPALSAAEKEFMESRAIQERITEIRNLDIPAKNPKNTELELAAIRHYGGRDGSTYLNKYLSEWRSQITGFYKGYATVLARALSKLPEYNGTVYSGLVQDVSGLVGQLQQGEQMVIRSFVSSSIDEAVARRFSYSKGGNIVLEIEGIKGAPDISGFVTRANEGEVLISPNAVFEIRRIEDIMLLDESGAISREGKKYVVEFKGYVDDATATRIDARMENLRQALELEKEIARLKADYLFNPRIVIKNADNITQPGLVAEFINQSNELIGELHKYTRGDDLSYIFECHLPGERTTSTAVQRVFLKDGFLNAELNLPEMFQEMKIETTILDDAIRHFANTRPGQPVNGIVGNWAVETQQLKAYREAFERELLNRQKAAKVEQAIKKFKSSCDDKDLLALVDKLTEEMKGDLEGQAKLFNVNGAPGSTFRTSQKKYPTNLKVTDESRKLDVDFGSVQKYLHTETERKPFELEIHNGAFSANGTRLEERERIIFVMNEKGNIYVALEDRPNVGHAIMLAGADLASAGILTIDNGIITLSNWSGHYHPEFESLRHLIIELTARGVDLNSIRVDRVEF